VGVHEEMRTLISWSMGLGNFQIAGLGIQNRNTNSLSQPVRIALITDADLGLGEG
jgi:phage gp46-like protein